MNKIIKGLLSLATVAVITGVTSCSDDERTGWTIQGTITGANDSILYIERPSGLAWVIVDSVTTDKNGEFSYTAPLPNSGVQSIYRVRLGERAVYFPIDSTETVTLKAKNVNMERVHKLAGTEAAAGFNATDSVINAAINRVGELNAINDSQLLSDLGDIIINDPTCIVSYYVINRPIGANRIFTPDNKLKVKLIGAAANRYNTLRPNDSRGAELLALYNEGMTAVRGGVPSKCTSMEATLLGRPEVDFTGPDENGKDRRLSDVLDRGGVTVLSLIRYDDSQAGATTIALGDIWNEFHPKGLEIFQIGIDDNRAYWRQNAMAMPWTTVYGAPDEIAELLVRYNSNPITGGPSCFVFDADGELVSRVDNPAELKKAISKLL